MTTLLAYHMLRTADAPLTAQELGERIEDWTARHGDADIDLDLVDAFSELRRLCLVTELDDGSITAIGLVGARQVLGRMWIDLAQKPSVEVTT
jgi:hypothetical protein